MDIFYYHFVGLTFGATSIVALTSFIINIYTISTYGGNTSLKLLIASDITSILFVIYEKLIINYDLNSTRALYAFFYSCMIAAVLIYTTLRSRTLIRPIVFKFSIFSYVITCLAVFLRTARINDVIPSIISRIIVYVSAPITLICATYSIFVIGKLVRSNPSASNDLRQVRIERLSNIVVLVAGSIQIANISISLTNLSMLGILFISLTLLLFTLAELLVQVNKNMTDRVVEPTGMSFFQMSVL